MQSGDSAEQAGGHLAQADEKFCRELLTTTQDWPKQGINFVSICPLLENSYALQSAVNAFATRYAAFQVTHVAGIEARGFAIASAVAFAIKAGFVMIRKQGKLPPPVRSLKYQLEYGAACLEIPETSGQLSSESRVVVIDDIIATGGTMLAAYQLLREAGVNVVETAVVVELSKLKGREALHTSHLNLHSLLNLDV